MEPLLSCNGCLDRWGTEELVDAQEALGQHFRRRRWMRQSWPYDPMHVGCDWRVHVALGPMTVSNPHGIGFLYRNIGTRCGFDLEYLLEDEELGMEYLRCCSWC